MLSGSACECVSQEVLLVEDLVLALVGIEGLFIKARAVKDGAGALEFYETGSVDTSFHVLAGERLAVSYSALCVN